MSEGLTLQHREEAISLAHVAAIAGAAGVMIGGTNFDYKVDGTFRKLAFYNGKKGPTGFPLDWQLKASKKPEFLEDEISYEMEADAWNFIAGRNLGREGVPIILILCCLDKEEPQWVKSFSKGLVLRKSCYWHYLEGEAISNTSSKTIKIPLENKLTPQVLVEMLESLDKKQFHELYAK